jgi:hypothetical protein
MNNLFSLAYNQRKLVGESIRIFPNENIWRVEKVTTIKEVAVCPWGHPARMMYLTALESAESLPYRARLAFALNYVTDYFKDNLEHLDLRVTYFTEAKSDKETSKHLHMMLDARDFEFLN